MTEILHTAAELLDKKGVDYRVIGSHALHLYGRDCSLNDIDLIVPRNELRAMPEIRQKLKREFGRSAVIGTYPSMKVIDFSEHTSLTHKELRVDLDDSTMDEVDVSGIKTLSPETLTGMYGTIGIDRRKDAESKQFLSDLSDKETDPAFREFQQLREEKYPLYKPLRIVKNAMIEPIPKSLKLAVQDTLENMIEGRHEH